MGISEGAVLAGRMRQNTTNDPRNNPVVKQHSMMAHSIADAIVRTQAEAKELQPSHLTQLGQTNAEDVKQTPFKMKHY